MVVLAVYSDTVKFWGALGNHLIWNSKQAGEELANKLEYDSHGYVTSALLFLDIIVGNSDAALKGLIERLGSNFPIFGGAASDDMLFYETFQYLENKVYTGSIVGLGISGEYTAAGVAMHGFLPIGIERIVTRSEGTTLYELDGKPAASIYEEYFGKEVRMSHNHANRTQVCSRVLPRPAWNSRSNDCRAHPRTSPYRRKPQVPLRFFPKRNLHLKSRLRSSSRIYTHRVPTMSLLR